MGFFKLDSHEKDNPIKNGPCVKCPFFNTDTGIKKCLDIDYEGKGKKGILLLKGFLTYSEYIQKIYFDDESIFLKGFLRSLGIKFHTDCYRTAAVKCYSQKKVTKAVINHCRHNLFNLISKLKPKKIIVFDQFALNMLIGDKVSISLESFSTSNWMNMIIPDQDLKTLICPVFNINFALSYLPNKIFWRKDAIKSFMLRKLENQFKNILNASFTETATKVEILDKKADIILLLNKIISEKYTIAFDYETTGKKPYDNPHKILCVSICYDNSISYSFDLKDLEVLNLFKYILKNPDIKKISHNLVFENLWSNRILQTDVNGWYFDTMIAAHVLDNSSGITGLKHQTYINFGIIGYDDSVKPYIKSEDSKGSSMNRLEEMGQRELKIYCALDSLFCFRLYEKQKKILEKDSHLHKGFLFFMEGVIELAKVSLKGFHFNQNRYTDLYKTLSLDINNKLFDIQNSKEASQYFQEKGKKLNIKSSSQLRELLFDINDYTTDKRTAKNEMSVDKDVLAEVNIPFTKSILEYRKLLKIRDTYLNQFAKESNFYNDSYYIFTFFNLNIVKTYRSSSSNPNMQNVPKREEFAKKMCRSLIIPRPGNFLAEIDFSGIEVGVGCCYHKDPTMINYVTDPETDMHRDMASEIFLLEKSEIDKELRYLAKNKMVFPQFYGDYWKACALNLWESFNKDQLKLVKKNGFKTLKMFEQHIKKIEWEMWHNRFPVYTEWKEKNYLNYLKTGYVELLTGFRMGGIMNEKEANNGAIQGTAFHVLLWCLIQINRYLHQNKTKTKLIGQIHDSIILDVCPSEYESLYPVFIDIMTKQTMERFKWLIVPLSVEIEKTDINGSWDTMK